MARAVPHIANPLLRVSLPMGRSRIVLLLLSVAFLALVARAVWLQVISNEFLQKKGEERYSRVYELPATRGKILDRNGVVLASSLPTQAITAFPGLVRATPDQVAQLAKLLNVTVKELNDRLADESRSFVYLSRHTEAEVADQIRELRIAGIHQIRTYKRHYAEAESLAQLIGITDAEDNGQEGIELAFQRSLAGRTGTRRVIRDRLGRTVEEVDGSEPVDGGDVTLSIDSRIQFATFNALKRAMSARRAKAASAVVLDAQTGEVLAIANLPTYNSNQRGQMSPAQMRNRALTDTYEPGSTIKPLTVAMALDSGKFRPDSMINVAPGKMKIGPATISDAHRSKTDLLSVTQIVQKSSNIGTAKIALALPAEQMWKTFTQLGLGQAPKLGFPGAVAGRIRPYKSWRPIEQATMSYGHGLSVSLLQIARAYTPLARDGDLVPISLLKRTAAVQGTPIFEPDTVRAVRRMLELASGPDGTAPEAQITGYRVAGKTGTAQKLENGVYVEKYVASFVGFAPASRPRVVVAVMIDEPIGKHYYGGEVAAPVFATIMTEALRTLRVEPDAEFTAPVIPVEVVREST